MSVHLEGVSFVRQRRRILSDISWTIEKGEKWVVIGPNGSGKTSLLKILAGYLWPTQGMVEVLGQRFGTVDLRQLRCRIGWVGSFLQEFIPPGQKVYHVIAGGLNASIGPTMLGNSQIELGRVERAARLAICDSLLSEPYGRLSQGEKQRVLLARAMVGEPELLLLDEPCAGLDMVAREYFLRTLEKMAMHRRNISIVFVTHHVEEVSPMFFKAVVMKTGRFVASGPCDVVLRERVLEDAFGVPITLIHHNGRFSVQCKVDAIDWAKSC